MPQKQPAPNVAFSTEFGADIVFVVLNNALIPLIELIFLQCVNNKYKAKSKMFHLAE